jgi:phenylacetate-CoA ligase
VIVIARREQVDAPTLSAIAQHMRDLLRSVESRVFDLAIPSVYRVAGRPQFQLLQELRARDRWTPEQVAKLQLVQLQKLVSHAVATVPYYAELFAKLGITASDIRTLDDYAKLPLLTKDAVRENMDRLVSTTVSRRIASTSGGSTGVTTRFCHTRDFRNYASAAWFRNYGWTGLPLGCRKFYVWGHPNEQRYAKELKGRFEHWLHRRLFFNAWNITSEQAIAWVEEIERFGASFGYGYASALCTVAQLAGAAGKRPKGVRAVMSSAEPLYPHQRRLIEEFFGCRLFDQYGSREVWSIASECKHGEHHVNSDLHVVEHVLMGGEIPNVVVTALHNYGMPLLRYLNEDLAAPGQKPCACGLPYPTIGPVQGRTSDNFKTPDGRIVHCTYLVHMMSQLDEVTEFQFVQRSLSDVTLSVVRAASFDESASRALDTIRRKFAHDFGFPLKTEFVDVIQRPPSGKTRFSISLV